MFKDEEDFLKALSLMDRYSEIHAVKVHGYSLMHNHGHWMFEASTEESISNLMRDMQGCYSRYLNKKYKDAPELLVGPLDLPAAILSKYFRAGPVNWTPRFDALHLDERGFRKFLRYIENNPVRAGLVRRAWEWKWSSAAAHCLGESQAGRLCLAVWENVFERPETVAADWAEYLVGPEVCGLTTGRRIAGPRTTASGWARRAVEFVFLRVLPRSRVR